MYTKVHRTANPLSSAPTRMQFVDGVWVYKPVNTKKQRRAQFHAIWMISLPVELAALVMVAGSNAMVLFLADAVDVNPDLHNNFGQLNVTRNAIGILSLYAIMTLNAILVWLWNNGWRSVALRLTKNENHETLDEFEDSLAWKLLSFQAINGYFLLFYW